MQSRAAQFISDIDSHTNRNYASMIHGKKQSLKSVLGWPRTSQVDVTIMSK